jgi:peptidoglycan/xylan/chitin deacetylase (PgdA/CDA1 family)
MTPVPPPRAVVTTSWDDGHVLDLRLTGLLEKYQVPGTLYVAPENHELDPADRLSPAQLVDLSQRFEIGAHTVTHRSLTHLPDEQARAEIVRSREVLEDVVGAPVRSFCYPRGAYRPVHVAQVREAGFRFARTVERFAGTPGGEVLTTATTVHAYRHWSDAVPIARTAGGAPRRGLRYLLNWDDLAIALFDRVADVGGTFHLWGHSWEVEANDDWHRLERVLAHIGGRDDVGYRTNGQLVPGGLGS